MGAARASPSAPAPESISFEIKLECKDESKAAPPVKQRLEHKSQLQLQERDQLTHAKIQEKLERAYERKA